MQRRRRRRNLTEPIEQLIELSLVGSIPELVSPQEATFSIQITEVETDGYVDGSARLIYSDGSFTTPVPPTPQGGGVYSATLTDLPCGSQLSWYFSAEDSSGTTRLLPSTGSFTAAIADGVEDIALVDFNTSAGWTASTTATGHMSSHLCGGW